ncbi:hypothetical protein PCYB_005890 [Plasmodium cynomolgi strain B]|uniref:CYIR protein n=1 Tax=Plasmodium cynomolgi (strain B) TaxID=1120755 RepID=K6V398_PLACD|nr:hypothetical protein PCYB_005890 [Plasmodium cynomolgi strain B]GAB69840.1 hypothetical protein PCYB_005890 [Plasmodium cynomolgi strain B]
MIANFLIIGRNESLCIKNIYDNIGDHFQHTNFYKKIFNLIYDINKDDLDKMNKLYSLYENYSKLNTIIDSNQDLDKQQLLTLSTACCTDYIKASYICNGGNNKNNNKFCEKLKAFKSKYEELYNKVDTNGFEISANFKKLTQCGNTNIVSTALVGTAVGLIPLLGVLYKFTPLGQYFNYKKRKLSQLCRNNNEEMDNIKLMDQESEHISYQQGGFNIKYHSV